MTLGGSRQGTPSRAGQPDPGLRVLEAHCLWELPPLPAASSLDPTLAWTNSWRLQSSGTSDGEVCAGSWQLTSSCDASCATHSAQEAYMSK